MQCVVLCGGHGTRLGPGIKTLRYIAGRPFMEHKLRTLADAGITDVVLLCGPYLQEHLDTLHQCHTFGLSIEYWQDDSLGTGGAIAQALPALAPTFWITYGDSLCLVPQLYDPDHVLGSALADLTVVRHPWPNVQLSGPYVVAYSEHPVFNATHLDAGLIACRWEVFAGLLGQSCSLQAAFTFAIAGRRVMATEVNAPIYHLNTPEDLARTEDYLDQTVR